MFREMCRAKLHRLTVTETNINYEGSITIDKALLKAANILPSEKVQVVNLANAQRFNTYAIEGSNGEVCLNGAAARLASVGDLIIVISYALVSEDELPGFKTNIVHVDLKNKIKQ